jgi:hypothetical protein
MGIPIVKEKSSEGNNSDEDADGHLRIKLKKVGSSTRRRSQ